MRILPAVLYGALRMTDEDARTRFIETQSAITHAHPRCCFACGIYGFVIRELMRAPERASIRRGLEKAETYYRGREDFAREEMHFRVTFAPNLADLPRDLVSSTGYVIHALEASLWCVLNASERDLYADTVLTAVNLGDDCDTTACIAGGMAALISGTEGIPRKWINTLARRGWIDGLCRNFAEKCENM